jgi:hypothetical protein
MVTVQVEAPVVSNNRGDDLHVAVAKEIEEFDHWFQSQGNEPLVRSEVAILKTYFAWKLNLAMGGAPPSPG